MNAKMKVLSLALLGLVGYAGSAAAGCPALPGPWTSLNAFQGTGVTAAPGLDGSACRFDSAISAGASGFATAQVQDDSPSAEPNYRAQFMINLDALGSPSLTTVANVFSATAQATGTGINLAVFGDGTGWRLSYIMVDANNPSGFFSGSVPLPAGSKHVEFQLTGLDTTSSTFNLWVENNTEGTPDITQSGLNMSSVAGIDSAFLGLAAPSNGFVAAYAGTAAQFDRFDSRRSTFIGF